MVFDDLVDGVVIPASDGRMGVLAGHAPMVALLSRGELKAGRQGLDSRVWIIEGGFAGVRSGEAEVLTRLVEELNPLSEAGTTRA